MPNKDNSTATEGATADLTSPREISQANRDLSQEREARYATIVKQVAETAAREMIMAHVQYTAMFNEMHAPAIPTTLKITSGVNGFKVMDPFDWTKDRNIYQHWQLWSDKARHALKTMDGDSEDNKISHLHHWISSAGIEKIENWKNNKVLISQEDYHNLTEERKQGKYSSEKIESYFPLFKPILAPRSNPLLAVEELKFVK